MTLFWTKPKRAKLESICAKIALKCHISQTTAKNDVIPFIKTIMEKEKATPIINWLKLGSDEVEYLTNMKKL